MLLCVVPRFWLCRPPVLLVLWPAVLLWSVMPCAELCPWVLCCAILLRVAPPCVVLLCAVSCCLALFGAAARCIVPSGAVRCPGVLCLPAPCVALSPCAVCSVLCVFLAWSVDACCCSPLCFVLCASRGVLLCFSCPLRPVRCWAVLYWCGCVVLFAWSVLFLAPGAAVRRCLLRGYPRCRAVLLRAVRRLPVARCVVLRPPARVAGCPVVRCGLLCGPPLPWCPAPLCCAPWFPLPCGAVVSCPAALFVFVLCPVVLCFRVLLCCGALSSFLPCWWRWFSVSPLKSPVKPVKMVFHF